MSWTGWSDPPAEVSTLKLAVLLQVELEILGVGHFSDRVALGLGQLLGGLGVQDGPVQFSCLVEVVGS